MKYKWLLLWALLLIIFVGLAHAQQTGDGIPDNCEYTGAAYYQANVFPRYEPPASRLVLVDWSTTADVRELETGLVTGGFYALGWSVDCRYLAGAIINAAGNYDTVVWDAVNGGRVGTISDAVGQPHFVTWGPSNYLVVETRNGAILWNVPANSQLILTTSWDAYTVRNFSRLRWDAENNQLIVNLAVGGRVAYDLTTGQEVPMAANTTHSIPTDPNALGTVVIGGNAYPCQIGYSYGYRNWFYDSGYQVPGVYARYSFTDHLIYLALDDVDRPDETLQVIEGGLDIIWFEFRGWSANCRYFAASLGNADGTSDTAVFDIVENRRVGTFVGARAILHPLSWSTTGDALVITTRDGGYLWYLPTDTRTLINTNVETALADRSGITSFYRVYWDNRRGQLLAVQVGSGNAVTVYDIYSGTQVAVYSLGVDDSPVSILLSSDGSHILVYGTNNAALWNRESSASILFSDFAFNPYYTLFSPDNRYLASFRFSELVIWDLQNPNGDTTPNYVYSGFRSYNIAFMDNATLTNAYGEALNVATGEITRSSVNVVQPAASLAGTTGSSIWRGDTCSSMTTSYNTELRQLEVRDLQTDALLRVIESNLNQTNYLQMSPDCRYVGGEVAIIGSGDTPYDAAPLDDIDRDRRSEDYVFWNVETGERIYEFQHPYRWDTYSGVWWSPSSERAVVRTTEGYFILDAAASQAALLLFNEPGANTYRAGINSYPQVYWDYQRGQVLISGWSGVFAFDMQTGIERYRFSAYPEDRSYYYGGCDFGGCYFSLSPDNTTLFVSGFGAMGIWNLDTLEHQHVDVRSGTAYAARTQISPDGRYLVIARNNIRVWDLTALPEDFEERDPVVAFQGPDARIRTFQFVDNTTIEVTTSNGEISYWDITTGAQVER